VAHLRLPAQQDAQVRFVLGTATHVDAKQKVVSWASSEGGSGQVGYDRLILTADLGGLSAAANPLHVSLSGSLANAVTRAYYLIAMSGNRTRVLADWSLNAISPPGATSFGLVSAQSVPLDPDQPRA
jgi:NADH:ubiquinone reductase (H+-translocating)